MSPRAHGLGVASAACGLLLCILPVLAWYSADLPTGSDSLTGYGASAATWVLPVAGVILIAVGVLCVWWRPATGTRVARILGALVVVAAVVGVVWATRAALAPPGPEPTMHTSQSMRRPPRACSQPSAWASGPMTAAGSGTG